MSHKVDLLKQVPLLAPLWEAADHVDVKVVEGEVSLREFLAGMLSYNPGWVQWLYRVRGIAVRFIGLKQEGIPQVKALRPDEISMTPGDNALFFTVRAAREEQYWISEATESHLTAYLGVVVEPLAKGNRFHVLTIVQYHRWTGPLYFNLIRPFHHLVVRQMAQAGLAYDSGT